MKFYGRPFSETTKANAGKLELALALFREKLISNPEAALRLDTPLFRAFHNFSNAEIEAAVEEAKNAGSDTVVLEAITYVDAAAEAEAVSQSKQVAGPVHVPSTFQSPAPVPASVRPTFTNPFPASFAKPPTAPSTATAPQVGAAAKAAAHAVEAAPVKNPFSTPAGEAPQSGSNEPTN